MALIELKNVGRAYESGTTSVRALDDVTLEIEKGEFVSVVGPSGSGKTTLLNLIGCLDKPTSGKVKVCNRNVAKMASKKLDTLRLRKIGFVFQTFNLIPTLTALENVELALSLTGLSGSGQRERAGKLLGLVGLSGRTNHRPSQLSSGENQRVAVARALANNPDIVLADEPTGNLDTETGNEIMRLMRDLNQRFSQTFIIVTHDPEVAKAASRMIYLKDGKVTGEKKKRRGRK